MIKTLCVIIAPALLFAVSAAAQTAGSSSVAGTVTDSSNLVMPRATVALINDATGEERNAVTNQIGEFVFPAIVPGTYTVRVRAEGFRPLESRGNVVTSSSRLALGTLQLQVGGVTESVSVSAQAQQVQTDSSDKSELVDLKELQEVAIRGKDPMSFLGTMPGVQKGVDPDYLGGRFGSSIPSFQGLPVATNDMMSDGVNGGDSGGGSVYAATVNLDGVSEVHVLMGNYNAEYGRAGGTMINMITKSGGKDYHGSAWYYKRHEEFNANNYFNNLNGITKPIYRFNILGGSIGGPVRLPKLNTKDKLFFFQLFERGEVKNAVGLERWTMPTALERSGNFTQSFNGNNLIVVKDPVTGQPFPGNIIPQNRANPYSLAEENILPLPNINGNGYNYVYQEPFVNQPRTSTTTRVDYRPTTQDTFSVTYKYWTANLQGIHFSSSPSPWNWVFGEYAFLASQGTVSWTRIISSHVVNELFAGGMHDAEQSPPVGPNCTQSGCGQWNPAKRQYHAPLDQLGQFNSTWNPLNFVPQATYGGIPTGFTAAASTFDGREPLTGYDANITASDNLTYTYGPHTFKAGIWFEHYRNGQAASSNFSGIIDFGQNSLDPTNTGYAFANAYVGHFNQYTEDLGRGQDNSSRNVQAAFLQDTWKVNRKLTMDIGLRVYYRDYWPLQSSGVASALVMSRYDPTWGGNPPVLYRPTTNNGQRVAVNPLTGAFYPQTYIGNIVPGTGNTCNNLSNANPCKLNGIVLQNDTSYEPGRGFRDDPGPQWDPRIGIAYDPFGD
ncbi:MAG TPA: carboxypeptidase-like regulatory domain-containing protein, partial [Bryobacteraceae bacterium]